MLQDPFSRQPVPAMSSGGVAALRSGAGALAAPCEASPSVNGPLELWRPPCVDIDALAAAPDGAERLAAAISAAPQGVLLLANALPAPFEAIGELFGRVTPQAGARANAGAHAAVATDGSFRVQPALRSATAFLQLVRCSADRRSLQSAHAAAYQAGTSRLVWKDAHGEGRWVLHAHVQSIVNGAARRRGGVHESRWQCCCSLQAAGSMHCMGERPRLPQQCSCSCMGSLARATPHPPFPTATPTHCGNRQGRPPCRLQACHRPVAAPRERPHLVSVCFGVVAMFVCAGADMLSFECKPVAGLPGAWLCVCVCARAFDVPWHHAC